MTPNCYKLHLVSISSKYLIQLEESFQVILLNTCTCLLTHHAIAYLLNCNFLSLLILLNFNKVVFYMLFKFIYILRVRAHQAKSVFLEKVEKHQFLSVFCLKILEYQFFCLKILEYQFFC